MGTAAAAMRLHRRAVALKASREQYEAAYATLASQRERMRTEYITHLEEVTAQLESEHAFDLFEARRQWYEQGATDALLGRLSAPPAPTANSKVVELRTRRPHSLISGADRSGC